MPKNELLKQRRTSKAAMMRFERRVLFFGGLLVTVWGVCVPGCQVSAMMTRLGVVVIFCLTVVCCANQNEPSEFGDFSNRGKTITDLCPVGSSGYELIGKPLIYDNEVVAGFLIANDPDAVVDVTNYSGEIEFWGLYQVEKITGGYSLVNRSRYANLFMAWTWQNVFDQPVEWFDPANLPQLSGFAWCIARGPQTRKDYLAVLRSDPIQLQRRNPQDNSIYVVGSITTDDQDAELWLRFTPLNAAGLL